MGFGRKGRMRPTEALAAPTLEQIRAARERLAGIVHPNPLIRLPPDATIGRWRNTATRISKGSSSPSRTPS